MKTLKVLVAFDVEVDDYDFVPEGDTKEAVRKKVCALLEHGTMRESFDAIGFNVSSFDVLVGDDSEDKILGAVKLVMAPADDFGGPVGSAYVELMLAVAAHAGEKIRGYVMSPGIMAVGDDDEKES